MNRQEILGPSGYNRITRMRGRVPSGGSWSTLWSLALESSLGVRVPGLGPDSSPPSLTWRGELGEQGGGRKVHREAGLVFKTGLSEVVHPPMLMAWLTGRCQGWKDEMFPVVLLITWGPIRNLEAFSKGQGQTPETMPRLVLQGE